MGPTYRQPVNLSAESEFELVVRDDHPTHLVRRWHVDDASSWHSSDWHIEGAANVCEVIPEEPHFDERGSSGRPLTVQRGCKARP